MPKKKQKSVNEFEKSTKLFFNDISKYSSLSKEEEYSLWERYKKDNDISARNKIIESNLKFVANVAKSYQGLGLSYSDLIAEGNCGLLKAIDKFDYTKGYKTISYSVWWIRQSILEALDKRAGTKMEPLPFDFEKQNDDNDDIIAQSTGTEEASEDFSISSIATQEKLDAVKMLMSILNENERKVIYQYFGFLKDKDTTLEKIGNEIGVTKERVRQIKEKALKKLRSEALKNSITSDIYK